MLYGYQPVFPLFENPLPLALPHSSHERTYSAVSTTPGIYNGEMEHTDSQIHSSTWGHFTRPPGILNPRKRLGLISVALLMLLNLASVPSQDSLGNIRVISDTWQVEFPNHVVFNLDRGKPPAPSPKCACAIGSPEAARGHTPTPNSPPAGASRQPIPSTPAARVYLPPGTKLEYHYLLRDSGGSRFETPRKTLEYTDTRFQWEETQIGPLALHHHGIPRSRVRRITGEVENGPDAHPGLDRDGQSRPNPGHGLQAPFRRRCGLPPPEPHHHRTARLRPGSPSP